MIRFACPGCNATFSVGDDKAGKTGKCPKCQSQFTIPTLEEAGVAAAPPPVAPPPAAPPPPRMAPPPPPPADATEIEIAPCPGCQARLSVAPEDIGGVVECPFCKTEYTAKRPGGSKPAAALSPAPAPAPADSPSKQSRSLRRAEEDDEDEDDRPRRRPARGQDDDEDERPRRGRRDRDEDEDDRPRRRKSGRGREPHRGGLVLTFALVGWLCCPIFLIFAWNYANEDLAKMDSGRMDSQGQGLTKAGKIIVQVWMVLFLINIVLGVLGFVIGLLFGGK